MKKITIYALAVMAIAVYACNGGVTNQSANNDSTATTGQSTTEEPVKQVKPQFDKIDAGVAAHMQKLTDNYLAVKNSLINDKTAEAAAASKNVVEAVKGFDKSLLTADQKAVYDAGEARLKQHAAQIAANTNLQQQRDQFSALSEDMYTLVKAFGAGKTIYHAYCPMAKNDQGAMWLSESEAIRNPYFGAKMMECGTVEEAIGN